MAAYHIAYGLISMRSGAPKVSEKSVCGGNSGISISVSVIIKRRRHISKKIVMASRKRKRKRRGIYQRKAKNNMRNNILK